LFNLVNVINPLVDHTPKWIVAFTVAALID
jgi:hypothetical protein